jgi:hypothetical protein
MGVAIVDAFCASVTLPARSARAGKPVDPVEAGATVLAKGSTYGEAVVDVSARKSIIARESILAGTSEAGGSVGTFRINFAVVRAGRTLVDECRLTAIVTLPARSAHAGKTVIPVGACATVLASFTVGEAVVDVSAPNSIIARESIFAGTSEAGVSVGTFRINFAVVRAVRTLVGADARVGVGRLPKEKVARSKEAGWTEGGVPSVSAQEEEEREDRPNGHRTQAELSLISLGSRSSKRIFFVGEMSQHDVC